MNHAPNGRKAELQVVLAAYEQARREGREFGRDNRGRPLTKADIYRSYGEYDRALEEWENEIAAARKSRDVDRETYLLIISGSYYAKVGSIPKCLEYLLRGLELAVQTGSHEYEVQALVELGYFFFASEQYERALTDFQKILAIARQTGNPRYEHLGLGNIAAVYGRTGHLQEAQDLIRRAAQIANQIGDTLDEANYTRNLALFSLNCGDGMGALQAFEYTQQLYRSLGIGPNPEVAGFIQRLRAILNL
jgi:tetratricopeptide (TPR) repeat protein